MNLNSLVLLDLQPSQFYLSQEKIENIYKWFNPADLSTFSPIPVKLLNNLPVITDGHTRSYIALKAGLVKIPLVWDEEELDWEMYRLCVAACQKRDVFNIAALEHRILNSIDYNEKWIEWCSNMQSNLIARRDGNSVKNVLL